ncbi:MAG TPA: hypothetical protein VHN99_02485, partial [Deinococcales bacterium]|nr:hypothetical protein [Deinococcales bacterium]
PRSFILAATGERQAGAPHTGLRREDRMSINDFLWGLWNGLTAWIVLVAHVFGAWHQFPVFDVARNGNWYVFGFLIGSGSPLLGLLNARRRS